MPWDAVAKLSSLLEQFQEAKADCREYLNADWTSFRRDRWGEGALLLPFKAGRLIQGRVYLSDETGARPAIKDGRQACYSNQASSAAEEFRLLAIDGGDIIRRIDVLRSELKPLVDDGGDGPPVDRGRWWLAYLFRKVASKIEALPLNAEGTGMPTYEVRIEGLFQASEDACERLLESLADCSVSRGADDAGNVSGTNSSKSAKHSSDFRSVNWFGTLYEFTELQAACVKVLWEAWENETPTVGDATVLEAAESHAGRLMYVFRDHAAWGTMIAEGSTKGTHRLDVRPTS